MTFIVSSLFALAVAAHPSRASSDSVPACSTLLESLARKIESNYAGFLLETRGQALGAYRRKLASLQARARESEGDDCFLVLRDLTSHFRDPHLFVFQNTYRDSAQIRDGVERNATRLHLAVADVEREARFSVRAPVDPIEGIWRDGAMRLAILQQFTDAAEFPPTFYAVVLTSDTATWQPGDVRATFSLRPDGAYDVSLSERNFAHRLPTARVHKRVMLRLSPGIWGKEYPLSPADSGLIDSADPHRATLVWRGDTPVLSIPSHDPSHRGALDTLLLKYGDTLRHSPRVIVDIRGNEGGSSWVTQPLLALLAGAERKSRRVAADDPVILSSEDQIAYVKARWQNVVADSATAQRLIARMSAHMGELVSIADSISRAADVADSIQKSKATPPSPPSAASPRVGILIDHGTVSAAEVFLLNATKYANVRSFGEPTEGALDYQSVNIVRIGDTARRWYLGYPTITARRDLPRGGMRGKGIAPDVRVDWNRIEDPIGYVDRALRKERP